MVIADQQLIKAAAASVRHAGLVDRMHMLANFNFIDCFRAPCACQLIRNVQPAR